MFVVYIGFLYSLKLLVICRPFEAVKNWRSLGLERKNLNKTANLGEMLNFSNQIFPNYSRLPSLKWVLVALLYNSPMSQ